MGSDKAASLGWRPKAVLPGGEFLAPGVVLTSCVPANRCSRREVGAEGLGLNTQQIPRLHRWKYALQPAVA
jgi:hypothetical protein